MSNNETNPLREESELDLIKTLESIRNNTYDLFGGRKDTWYKSYLKNLTDARLKVVRQSQSLPEKSLQDCKDEVAIKEGYKNFSDYLIQSESIDGSIIFMLEAAAELYAAQFMQPSQPEGKTLEEVKALSVKRYGNDINSFGQQRDGFVEGYTQAMREYANQPSKDDLIQLLKDAYSLIPDSTESDLLPAIKAVVLSLKK